jgi:hypothetical protein
MTKQPTTVPVRSSFPVDPKAIKATNKAVTDANTKAIPAQFMIFYSKILLIHGFM